MGASDRQAGQQVRMTGTRSRQPLWILLPLWCGYMVSAVASVPSDIAGLMQLLRQVEWIKADYSETVESTLLTHSMTSEGELEYRAPDVIRKVSTLGDSITIRGNRLLLGNGAASKEIAISDHAALEQFVVTLRATFSGDLDALEKTFRVEYHPAADRWTLALHPKGRQLLRIYARIDISGTGTGLDRIDMIEPNGDRRILTMRVRQRRPALD